MVFDVSACLFLYKDYSSSFRMRQDIIEDEEGNGIPNLKRREHLCWVAENFAAILLNSGEIEHPWKRDFAKNMQPHEMWDLNNSDGITIEVKSTSSEKTFRRTGASLSIPEQANSIILKIFIGKEGFELVKFVVNQGYGSWLDISDNLSEYKEGWSP